MPFMGGRTEGKVFEAEWSETVMGDLDTRQYML